MAGPRGGVGRLFRKGGLYFVETGNRITAINGHPSDQILAEMLSMITSDGVNVTSKGRPAARPRPPGELGRTGSRMAQE
jgi:hypothetical protein